MRFELIPGQGLLPVTIGMPYEALAVTMGAPGTRRDRAFGEDEDCWFLDQGLRVTLIDARVTEASVCPPGELYFEGKSLFRSRTQWKALVALEPQPMESVGFVILNTLGIAFTGLHDRVRSQFAVTAFPPGSWAIDEDMAAFEI
jgi:hypothetical protein